jgi:hypothetical protein
MAPLAGAWGLGREQCTSARAGKGRPAATMRTRRHRAGRGCSRRSVPEVTVDVDGVVVVLVPSRRRRGVLHPLPSDAGSSPKDTQPSEQICASKQTRVGAELPQPQTQSGLKAHSLSPANVGPRRWPVAAPREDRARAAREAGPPGGSGATQGPHSTPAQDTEAVDRAPLLALPPSKPGPDARGTPVMPRRGRKQLPWVMGHPPSGTVSVDHVPAGPRPEQLYPRVRKRDGGGRSQPCRRTARQCSPGASSSESRGSGAKRARQS